MSNQFLPITLHALFCLLIGTYMNMFYASTVYYLYAYISLVQYRPIHDFLTLMGHRILFGPNCENGRGKTLLVVILILILIYCDTSMCICFYYKRVYREQLPVFVSFIASGICSTAKPHFYPEQFRLKIFKFDMFDWCSQNSQGYITHTTAVSILV